MKRTWGRWWWLALLLPMAAGLARLHFEADVLALLPSDIPAVCGLKIYQAHFANSRQLILTVQAVDPESAKAAAQAVAANLRHETNLVADATWQPPWQEHAEQMAELIGYLWLNQPPEVFAALAARLSEPIWPMSSRTHASGWPRLFPRGNGPTELRSFGLTELPPSIMSAAPGFGQGQDMFASGDGKFRLYLSKPGTN